MSLSQPDDNVVDMRFVYPAAMDRLNKQQETIVLLEAQVAYLKECVRELRVGGAADDEGGVLFTD